MKILALLQRQSKPILLPEGIALVLGIGAVDWMSGYEVTMSVFYGLPILAVIWLCGPKEGLFIAIFCGISWWWTDILSGHV